MLTKKLTTFFTFISQIEKIENELQLIKWNVFALPKKQAKDSIVEETAGILGRSFPDGLKYQKQMRQKLNLILPQDDLKTYEHAERIKQSYQNAIKQYPPYAN